MNLGQDLNSHCWKTHNGYTLIIWVIKVPNENDMIDDHGYDGNHENGIIYLTDKGIGVIQSLL